MRTSSFQFRFKNKLGKVQKGGELKIQEKNAVIKIGLPFNKYHQSSPQPKSLPPLHKLPEHINPDSFNKISNVKLIRNPSLPEITKKSPKIEVKYRPMYKDSNEMIKKSIENNRKTSERYSFEPIQQETKLVLKKKSFKNMNYHSYYNLSGPDKQKIQFIYYLP